MVSIGLATAEMPGNASALCSFGDRSILHQQVVFNGNEAAGGFDQRGRGQFGDAVDLGSGLVFGSDFLQQQIEVAVTR